jgi:hypothetical protein
MRTTSLRHVTLLVVLVIALACAVLALVRTTGRNAGAVQDAESLKSRESMEGDSDAPLYSITARAQKGNVMMPIKPHADMPAASRITIRFLSGTQKIHPSKEIVVMLSSMWDKA